MIVLGVDTTGQSMSVAVADKDRLWGEVYIANGLKHSITLMPAIEQLLKLLAASLDDIDAFAVSTGPGSFTGIRIGTAAVAALAYAANKPVYAVNTLDALIENAGNGACVCAMMDARRGEVYTTAKQGENRIVPEGAMPLMQLLELLEKYPAVTFVGDGVPVYKEEVLHAKPDSLFVKDQFLLQRASSVCACAIHGQAQKVTHDKLKPHYLRQSQAERMKEGKRSEQQTTISAE